MVLELRNGLRNQTRLEDFVVIYGGDPPKRAGEWVTETVDSDIVINDSECL